MIGSVSELPLALEAYVFQLVTRIDHHARCCLTPDPAFNFNLLQTSQPKEQPLRWLIPKPWRDLGGVHRSNQFFRIGYDNEVDLI
jgi:hypothetical protein